MPGLGLFTHGTHVSLISERLRVEVPPQEGETSPLRRDIPIFDVEYVILLESVDITVPAIAELMRRNIPVVIASTKHAVTGICIHPLLKGDVRLAQYKAATNYQFALKFAKLCVKTKILNSKRLLQRLIANRNGLDIANLYPKMNDLAEKCDMADSFETLRGYEGTAAGEYFKYLDKLFPDDCPFEYRSRRPPHNPANALLSFAYTILAAEIESATYATGLDPAIGFYHEPDDNRPSLVLDLMEPFRAAVGDAMVIDLLNHGVIKSKEHFEENGGGFLLNREGRKRFFVAYEKRLNREFIYEKTGMRTTLRNEIYNQISSLRDAIMNDTPFEPFVIN